MNVKTFLPLAALTFALFICNTLFAQKKQLPGYYISVQGDTVKGVFPSYAQWNKNPLKVDFITAGATGQVHLTPQNSLKFVIDGHDEYLSYTGQRLVNPIEDNMLFSGKSFVSLNDSFEHVVTFLRLVTRTTGCDIYVLNDAKRINFFYQLPGQPVTELRYKKILDQNYIREMADYRQQINILFADGIIQKNLIASLEKLQYREKDLSSFFEALFPVSKAEGRKRRAEAEWVVSAGVSLNMVSVQADRFFSSVPKTYGSSVSPLLSVGFLLPIDRNFGKYFLYPQVKLYRYKNTGEENQGTFINATTYKADLVVVTEVSGGVNIVNQENLQCFFTGGFGMLAQIGAKQERQYYDASNYSPYGNAMQTELPSLTYSIDASVGVSLKKKILLSATYIVPSDIGNFVEYSPRLSGVQFRVGYKLP